jgi:sulfur carrier protein ThiS
MRISVRLFLHLKKYIPTGDGTGDVDVPNGATVEAVLDQLGVPREMKKIILADGRHAVPSQPLREGQTLTVYPPLDGG